MRNRSTSFHTPTVFNLFKGNPWQAIPAQPLTFERSRPNGRHQVGNLHTVQRGATFKGFHRQHRQRRGKGHGSQHRAALEGSDID